MINEMNYPRLFQFAEDLKYQYTTADPFPSIYIDNFLPLRTYTNIEKLFPGVDSDIWKMPSNRHTRGKLVTKTNSYGIKEMGYSADVRSFFLELNSGSFLTFLEIITGIKGLIPDPYFAEAGFHCTKNNGFLDIHADFSHHERLGLERRVNLIYYLNENWDVKFGGDLKLYDSSLNIKQIIAPIGNRAVIFSTSDKSYHGHPEPLRCPPNIYRRSIAMYYYSIPTRERFVKKVFFPNDPSFVHQVTD